jgi:hypothetical protein
MQCGWRHRQFFSPLAAGLSSGPGTWRSHRNTLPFNASSCQHFRPISLTRTLWRDPAPSPGSATPGGTISATKSLLQLRKKPRAKQHSATKRQLDFFKYDEDFFDVMASMQVPKTCKVVLAETIAKNLLAEVNESLGKLRAGGGNVPCLAAFLANDDGAAVKYAEWSKKTCEEKSGLNLSPPVGQCVLTLTQWLQFRSAGGG